MDFKDTWDGQNLILSRRGKAAEGVGLEALSLTFVIMPACFAKTVAHVMRYYDEEPILSLKGIMA